MVGTTSHFVSEVQEHMSYGITEFYLRPKRGDDLAIALGQTRFINPQRDERASWPECVGHSVGHGKSEMKVESILLNKSVKNVLLFLTEPVPVAGISSDMSTTMTKSASTTRQYSKKFLKVVDDQLRKIETCCAPLRHYDENTKS